MAFGLPAVAVTLVGKPPLAPPAPTTPPGQEMGMMTVAGSFVATMVPAGRAPAVLPGPVVVVPPTSPLIIPVPPSVPPPVLVLLLPHMMPLPPPARFFAGGGVSVQAEARTPAASSAEGASQRAFDSDSGNRGDFLFCMETPADLRGRWNGSYGTFINCWRGAHRAVSAPYHVRRRG